VISTRLFALSLVAGGLVLYGCGGSSKGGSTGSTAVTKPAATTSASQPNASPSTSVTVASGAPLTRASWIAEGDSICARLNAQLAVTDVKTARDFARALPQAAAYERAALARLAALVPPASKRRDWQEFLRYTQEGAANTAKLGQSAQGANFVLTGPLVASTQKIRLHAAAVAKRDGFKVCATL
jgi:hypothetical protein